MEKRHPITLNRRDLLRLGGGVLLAGAAGIRAYASSGAVRGGLMQETPCLDGGPLYTEVFPTSPFVLQPFTQDLPNPAPLKPSNPANWTSLGMRDWARPDPRTGGRQDVDYITHQVGFDRIPVGTGTRRITYLKYPEPLYYRLALQVGQHNFTNSRVLPIRADGRPVLTEAGIILRNSAT